jgi:hypothetical protein
LFFAIKTFLAVVFHVAEVAKPCHVQRLIVIIVMPMSAWLATLNARAAFDVSALDGGTQQAVSFGGSRVTVCPFTNRAGMAAIGETLLVPLAVAGFAPVVMVVP